MFTKRKLQPILLIVLIIVVAKGFAQNYPDTLWVPVVFRDFHADGSNPEFEMVHTGGVMTDLIEPTLDADNKPISTETYLNWYIKYWYRDWADSAQGDFTKPVYKNSSPNGSYIRTDNVAWDTTFKNITILDTLPFLHLGNGVYDFRDDNFFPLDGKGFGYEGFGHNFAFTMELVTTFIMKPGLVFDFLGDDDVWAFVDGRLMMDLGNLHSAASGSFDTDTISGLTIGQEYDFHLFFAERHSTGSHIRITTNIVSTHIVSKVTIEANPDTAIIPAGDSILYTGKVWYDSTGDDGILHELVDTAFSNNITWTLISNNTGTDPTKSSLLPSVGDSSIFTTTEAYETFTVIAAYEDPVSHQVTSDTMQIQIIPDVPDHISAEASSDTTTMSKKQNDNPMDTLTIAAASTTGNGYGMIRDKYGNFINYSKSSTWALLSSSVLQSVVSGNAAIGEGVVTKSGFSGSDKVSIKDNDNSGVSYTDTFTVIVQNDVPVANNDNYSSAEDVVLNVPSTGKPSVLANDLDNLSLKAYLVTGVDVAKGTLNWGSSNDGSFTFVPKLNFNGNVTFTYKAYDGEFYSNVATVTIIVGANNDAPVANDTSFTTAEDTQLTVTTPGILNNDTDIDGDNLIASLVQNVSSGTLVLNANGSFVYTPVADFNGAVSFTYQAVDDGVGNLNSNVATVTINITPVNDAPDPVLDAYSTNEDITLTTALGNGVLANDSDKESNAMTAILVDNVTNGTLTLNSDGSFTYVPTANFNGADSFTYKAADVSDTSAKVTVSITVNAVDDAPVAVGDNYTVVEDNTLTVTIANGILKNDTDVEGTALTALLVTDVDAGKGSLALNANGSFVFTPVANFTGAVFFTYQANDGNSNSASVNVWINVTPVNDAPVANDDGYSVTISTKLSVALPGVMSNDNDVDLDILTVELVSGTAPANGTLVLSSDGSFEYTPLAADVAIYTFKYKLSDGILFDTATVTLDVGGNNSAPTSVADTFSTTEDTPLNIAASGGILSNDTDPDMGTTLIAKLITDVDVSKGSLSLNADGSFLFTPVSNFVGTVTFTYQAIDNASLSSNISTVTINVTGINDAPVANGESYSTDEDVALIIPQTGKPGLLANDVDQDGDALSILNASGIVVDTGTVLVNANGAFTYNPTANFNGTATFKYKVTDGQDSSAEVTTTITVNAVNDNPVISTISGQSIAKGASFNNIVMTTYISDVDNSTASLVISVDNSTNYTLTVDSATQTIFIVVKDSTWIGSEDIKITVTDPNGAITTQTVKLTVFSVERMPLPKDSIIATSTATITVQYYIPGYQDSTSAVIPYNMTVTGVAPTDPTSSYADSLNSLDTLAFGPYATDSVTVQLLGFSKLYPHDNSENRLFQYLITYPQLSDLIAIIGTDTINNNDIFDTNSISFNLIVDGQSDVDIIYIVDKGDGQIDTLTYDSLATITANSGLTQITVKAIATKDLFKSSTLEFTITLNPEHLQTPIATPAGFEFHTDSIKVHVYVENDTTNANIKYTTDGSAPDKNSMTYSDTIIITDNTTLKAAVLSNNGKTGPVMVEYYVKSIPTELDIYEDDTTKLSSTILVNAGTNQHLIAKIIDQKGDSISLSELDSNYTISWKITSDDGVNSAMLSNLTGDTTNISPIDAFKTIVITVTFKLNGKIITEEITVIINPGAPYRLWLEPDYDRLVSPNSPNPVDTIKLSPKKSFTNIYAVERDSLGNYIKTSTVTTWTSTDITTVTVAGGDANKGEGVVTKIANFGTVQIIADSKDSELDIAKDSVFVEVMAYWYDSLKIIANGQAVDTVEFNTNIDTTIYVYGHLDDGSDTWEKVNGKWNLIGNSLDYIIASAGTGHEYLLSPNDTASGYISVSLGDDTLTIPDTIFVKFIPGAPTNVKFIILTPKDSLIAGEKITAVVSLFNADNKPVYGSWSYTGSDRVHYSDMLGNGQRAFEPSIIVDAKRYNLLHGDNITEGDFYYASQYFEVYSDTVSFTLYYAPLSDSLHQMYVDLGNSVSAKTTPFKLLPGALADIEVIVNGAYPDTASLEANSGIVIKSVGVDKYGNLISVTKSNWTTSNIIGVIPNILYPDSTTQIFYETDTLANGTVILGMIVAKSIDNDTIMDSIYIKIVPDPAEVLSMLTQDLDGDGLLDAFVLTFDKSVVFPNGVTSNNIVIDYDSNGDGIMDGIYELADSVYLILGVNLFEVKGSNGTKYVIKVKEVENSIPQTGWQTTLTITGIDEVVSIPDSSKITSEDGASPVIWSITNKKDENGNTEGDVITIIFSEKIVNEDGTSLEWGSIKPNELFDVWYLDKNNEFHKADSVFADIAHLLSFDENTNTITVKMENGQNLTHNNFISLKFDTTNAKLFDLNQNNPDVVNQKVAVIVDGVLEEIKVGPNPSKPSIDGYKWEILHAYLTAIEMSEAKSMIDKQGGVVIAIDLSFDVPNGQIQALIDGGISGKIMIFDVGGNLVYEKENEGSLIPLEWEKSWQDSLSNNKNLNERRQLAFYWSGYSSTGMPAKPGVYRMISFFNVAGRSKPTKLTSIIAVSR